MIQDRGEAMSNEAEEAEGARSQGHSNILCLQLCPIGTLKDF